MSPRVLRALALAVVMLLAAGEGHAHTRSRSDSRWSLEPGGARVRLRISRLELTRLPPGRLAAQPGRDPVATYLADRLWMEVDGQPCTPVEEPQQRPSRESDRLYAWRLRCPAGARRVVHSALLLEEAPSHLHFARVETPAGDIVEAVLAGTERRFPLPGPPGAEPEAEPPAGSSLGRYLLLGIGHIATGYDHLVFVAALLLLARRLGEVTLLVTSFTVAHSVTLALAVLGLLRPEPAAVEALIGFSIALVAAENLWLLAGRDRWIPRAVVLAILALAAAGSLGHAAVSPLTGLGLALFAGCHFALLARARRPEALRAAVAFAFGLVHGFGFAGMLGELELPVQRLVPALFGFNLGVELGQLAAVLLFWPLLLLLARHAARGHRQVVELGSALVAALGVFWLVARNFA